MLSSKHSEPLLFKTHIIKYIKGTIVMSLFDAEINCDTNFVYKKYRDDISELIAYIEVYQHDLPAPIMAIVAELFQTISACETDAEFPNSPGLVSMLDKTTWKVVQSLKKYSVCLFIAKNQEYKKRFHKHKYKGVLMDDGQKFHTVAQQIESRLCKTFSDDLRSCYKGNTVSTLKELSVKERIRYLYSKFKILLCPSFRILKKEPFLPTSRLVLPGILDVDFTNAYNDAKDLLEKYQNVFPKVIKNGRNQSLTMSIFVAISTWIIPIILSIPVVLKIVDKVKVFICE